MVLPPRRFTSSRRHGGDQRERRRSRGRVGIDEPGGPYEDTSLDLALKGGQPLNWLSAGSSTSQVGTMAHAKMWHVNGVWHTGLGPGGARGLVP